MTVSERLLAFSLRFGAVTVRERFLVFSLRLGGRFS